MALFAHSPNPAALLAAIKKAIDDGHIRTWSYDADGDFTHTPEQWRCKAWLRPSVGDGFLRLSIVGNTSIVTTWPIYGVYHGRFIEELITHFHEVIAELRPTVDPLQSVDVCTERVAARNLHA